MQDWCDGAAHLTGEPGDADRKRILYEIVKALEFLHLRSIVHGNFSPRAVMWFPRCIAWKLVALGQHGHVFATCISVPVVNVGSRCRYVSSEQHSMHHVESDSVSLDCIKGT